MSATCRFCSQEFTNAQAVRAHLKGCVAYQQSKQEQGGHKATGARQAPLGNGKPLGSASRENDIAYDAFDPVKQLEKQVAASRLRLQLREVEDTHAEMDRRRSEQEQERQRKADQEAEAKLAREQEEEAAHWREEQISFERMERESMERQRRQERRATLQDIKMTVADEWTIDRFGLPDCKAQVLQAIDRTLSGMSLEDLPRDELLIYARDARDRVYREAAKIQDAEHEAARQAQLEAQQVASRKQNLIQHGVDYAKRELQDVDGLDSWRCWTIEQRVRSELQNIGGHESREEILDMVEDIFEAEGLGFDEDDED